jgi:hypothetical protein
MATLNSQQCISIQCTTYKQIQNAIEQMESFDKKIPRHLRTCNKCETLDDENHFFLNCK